MKINIQHGLPFISLTLQHDSKEVILNKVLLDTGSAGSVFSADQVLEIDLIYKITDPTHRIRGVGGTEFVFTKWVDQISLGDFQVNNFEIEVGDLDYGFDLDGILGLDFLLQVGVIIDLKEKEVFARA